MDEESRRGRWVRIVLILAIAGSAAGVLVYQYKDHAARREHDGALAGDMSGFDLADSPQRVAPAPPATAPADSPLLYSSLGMVSATADFSPGSRAVPGAMTPGLKEAALRSGARVSAYTARFRKKHPAMLKYSSEWLSHPDLKKLNDDYLRDRDQVKFLRGLAASKNFRPLIAKYAADPTAPALVMEFLSGLAREVPPDLGAAAVDALNEDKTIKRLLVNVAAAFGVPAAMLPGLADEPKKGPPPRAE